jgi:hypothetical protein
MSAAGRKEPQRATRAQLKERLREEQRRTAAAQVEISRLAAVVAPPRWTTGQQVQVMKANINRGHEREIRDQVPEAPTGAEFDNELAQHYFLQARNSGARNKAKAATGSGAFGRGFACPDILL